VFSQVQRDGSLSKNEAAKFCNYSCCGGNVLTTRWLSLTEGAKFCNVPVRDNSLRAMRRLVGLWGVPHAIMLPSMNKKTLVLVVDCGVRFVSMLPRINEAALALVVDFGVRSARMLPRINEAALALVVDCGVRSARMLPGINEALAVGDVVG